MYFYSYVAYYYFIGVNISMFVGKYYNEYLNKTVYIIFFLFVIIINTF